MKKISWILFLSLAYTLCFAQSVDEIISKRPAQQRLVNDFAHVMTPDQVGALEQKLVAYDDSTSVQIAIVTFKSIGNNSIDDVALQILRNWGVGNKKTNNGVVIVAAIDEHKVFIATGGGMEQSVPDITAKEIIDNEIVPHFRENNQDNFYRGFDFATDAIIKAAAGQYQAPEGYRDRNRGGKGGNILGLIIFVIIILVLVAGRGGGGGRGGMMNRTGFFPWIIASMLTNRGGGGGWSGGGGGGWSGGGGGGGFGGFGGGSGGGGGAGGSW